MQVNLIFHYKMKKKNSYKLFISQQNISPRYPYCIYFLACSFQIISFQSSCQIFYLFKNFLHSIDYVYLCNSLFTLALFSFFSTSSSKFVLVSFSVSQYRLKIIWQGTCLLCGRIGIRETCFNQQPLESFQETLPPLPFSCCFIPVPCTKSHGD